MYCEKRYSISASNGSIRCAFRNVTIRGVAVKYQLYTYDLWGNSKDGFEVNDVYRQSTIIDVEESTSDRAINRRLSAHGVIWDGEHGYTLYGVAKRDGRPIAELRVVK